MVFQRLGRLYEQMEEAYAGIAREMGFTCMDCPENCCTSYFRHHTRVEWAYFLKGLEQCAPELRTRIISRARDYVVQMDRDLKQGRKPDSMCPVNENGLCMLYSHRLMICRLHGVPTVHTRPDGQQLEFPGCFRSVEKTGDLREYPKLDRTLFYRELAGLEQAFVGPKIKSLPRVDLTLAEMIVMGLPKLSA